MGIKNLSFLVFIIFCCCNPLRAQFEGDQIFDESYIHEIEITTSRSLEALSDLFFEEFQSDNYTYTLADVVIDGSSVDSIGVRVKGGLSSFDPKRPLKFDFNEFVAGRKYDGLKKLNLHQGNMDPTYLRETLAYRLMRDAGVKTVRTSFAKVYYNGSYQGIYTLVEQIDDALIHNLFASADGALYKKGPAMELKYAADNSFPYSAFVQTVNQIPTDLLHEELPTYLDVESFLRFFATDIFVNGVDGPLLVDNNYYIYYEPTSETYVYIPWDYNLALYSSQHTALQYFGGNFIFERIKQNDILRERYLSTFCELLAYNFDEDRILDLIDTYRNLLEDEVPNDPYLEEIGDFSTALTYLESVVSSRVQALTSEINGVAPCSPLVNPAEVLDISINEIVASNNQDSGITDPAGSSADWIELYNNTSMDIPLGRLYLSNDSDFLKHWKFPDDSVLPANDYLIVWADRDIEEEGLHTDFKLNKSRGELYLSFENGDIVDSLSYADQTANIGLARVPNGTGPFTEQTTTFNASNGVLNSTQELAINESLQLFPNPAKESVLITFESKNTGRSLIELFDTNGSLQWQTEFEILQGRNQVQVPLRSLAAGVYSLRLIEKETARRSVRRLIVLE